VRRARLTQEVIALEKSPTEVATTTNNQLRDSVDCSDILELYDSDKIISLYENHDLNLQSNFCEDRQQISSFFINYIGVVP
jgi:hypothetical protein